MKKIREIRKRKVIIYYFLTIVIPCIILGILAFRGIRNDYALIENEQRGRTQEIIRSIAQVLNHKCDSIENILSQEVIKGKNIIFNDQNLDAFVSNFPIISSVFIHCTKDDQVSLLDKDLIYYPDQIKVYSENISTKGKAILENGWTYEFQSKKYEKAIKYYQKYLNENNSNKVNGEILNIIARIQKKQGNVEAALATYSLLSQDYCDVYLQGKIPMGLIAGREIAFIHLSNGDTLSCLSTTEQLLHNLSDRKWKINKAHFLLAIRDIKERIIDVVQSNDSNISRILNRNISLFDNIEIQVQKTEYLLRIISESTSINPTQILKGTSLWRGMIDRQGQEYFISLISKKGTDKTLGIIFNLQNLKTILEHEIRDKVDLRDIEWKILNNKGEILSFSRDTTGNKIAIISTLPNNLPSWTLEFYSMDKGLMSTLIQSNGGIYLYILIIILIILTLGLFFILQSVNNEIKLSRMKSQFITTVSHEFKSPLTSIRQIAEMLEQHRVPDPERRQFYYSAILKQSERLSHMIENILDFSRMEENQKIFVFQKADITTLVKDVVVYFQNLMLEKGFTIKYYCKDNVPSFKFDKEAMEQVLHNLIDNACKFSGSGKKVDVIIENKSNRVSVCVKDNGIGINKEDQEKVFNRFFRAGDELTQKVKGSGIGLTIVKQIVTAHGGQITLQSTPEKGSTFCVIIPYKNKG